MTLDEVIDLIQTWIVANGNEEITADVLRPILEAMVNQPNDLIGDLDNLTTAYQTDLVGAINEINSLISSSGLVIFTGTDLPDVHSFPTVLTPANFYVQLDGSTVLGMWLYNGNEWVAQVPQRTRTLKKFVSLIGVTVAGKTQTQWMAEAINLNISNGAVYECEPGDIIDFFINIPILTTGTSGGGIAVKRIYTRLCTGATSVTSVTANDLMPDGSEEVIIEGDLIIELEDIGTDDVWDAFNADPDQPFDMDNEMFVSAIQDGEPKLWQWIGGTGTFGSTATVAVEGDFLDLTAQPVVTIGVQTVTGDGVDNTDPDNPVLSFPTPAEIGTYDSGEIDALIAIKQSIPTGNFTLAPAQNNHTIANAGYDCTINPNTQTYADKTVVAMKNITDSTDCDIVCTAAIGWTYKVNDNATGASGTFTFPAGATCTIIKFEGTNKIYIDGGVE